MNAVIELIEKWSPGFGARIQPATAAEITFAQRTLPADFPREYFSFLERMGRDCGGLRLPGRHRTLIIESPQLITKKKLLAQDKIVFARHDPQDRCQDCAEGVFRKIAALGDAYRLVQPEGNHTGWLIASSLSAALLYAGFTTYRVPQFAVVEKFELDVTCDPSPEPTIDRARARLAAEHFFENAVSVNPDWLLHTRGDAAVMLMIAGAYDFERGATFKPDVSSIVCGTSQKIVTRIRDILQP